VRRGGNGAKRDWLKPQRIEPRLEGAGVFIPGLILFTQAGKVGTITLDDGKANAMSIEWFADLGTTLDQAEAADLSALVFRGRPRFFSGGLDIKKLPTLSAEELKKLSRDFAAVMLRVLGFPVPTA